MAYKNKRLLYWEPETLKYFNDVHTEITCPYCSKETTIAFDEDYMEREIDRKEYCHHCEKEFHITGVKELRVSVEFNIN